jgi:hypothetical protein
VKCSIANKGLKEFSQGHRMVLKNKNRQNPYLLFDPNFAELLKIKDPTVGFF